MKKRYLDVMEKALSAYSTAEIDDYFRSVQETRPTDQGFARLTINIGRMIAHGRRTELTSRFLPMMDFCAESMWLDEAANDFSVQEMVECIELLDASGAVEKERLALWRRELSRPVIYNQTVKSADETAHNWVLFSAVSEFLRMRSGLCRMDMDYIDMQLATQMRNLNEDGMYKDPGCPIFYDLIPRLLFSVLLFYGYEGKYRTTIDDALRRAALLTLRMQSTTGEIAYGGRSSQFYHNEMCICTIFEYEANRYASEGDLTMAAQFKRAASDALMVTEEGLSLTPIRHIKNRFQTKTKYGCEDYAYFGKYMITAASYASWAMHICNDDIEAAKHPLLATDALVLTDDFHKVFLRAGDYFAEADTCADMRYDACGVGRIHKRGVPSALCLSGPGTSESELHYDADKQLDFAITPGVVCGEDVRFCTRGKQTVLDLCKDETSARAQLGCRLDGKDITLACTVAADGVTLTASCDGQSAIMLPAFHFDGEAHTEIRADEKSLTVAYGGHTCRYETDGRIVDMNKIGCNRNGHYRMFYATGENKVTVKVAFDN